MLDNDSSSPASGTFEFGAKGDISSTDVPLLNSSSQPVTATAEALHSGSFNLAGNTGDVSGDWDPTPPDGVEYDYIDDPTSDTQSGFIGAAYFAGYIGTGTYDIEADITQFSDYGSVSGIEYAVQPVDSTGDVTVIYTYTPEPATMVLFGLGGLILNITKRGA